MTLALSAVSNGGGIQLASTVVGSKIPTVTAAGSTASPVSFSDTLSVMQAAQATAPNAAAEAGALYDDKVRAEGNARWKYARRPPGAGREHRDRVPGRHRGQARAPPS